MPAKKNSAVEILKKITSGKECPLATLVVSKDEIRRERIRKILCDAFIKDAASIRKLDARDFDLRDLERLAVDSFSQSLFASTQFWLIRNVDALDAAGQKRLQQIVESAPPGIKFILTAAKLNANAAFRKYFVGASTLIELDELKGFELTRWVQKELTQAGIKKFEENVPEILISIGEEDPDRIAKAIEHLALYVDGPEVKRADIGAVFIERPDLNEYELLDLLAGGNKVKAEFLLGELLSSGKNPFLLLSLLFRTYSNYLAIKVLESRGSQPGDVRQRLGMTPWVYNKTSSGCRRYSVDKLQSLIDALLNADSKLKNKSLGPENILSELIFKLAA